MHSRGKKFTDFNEIRKEIERVTESKVGNSKNVSDEEINLHIHSPNVLDLTLIDLPGLVQIPVAGQDPKIKEQIEKIVLNYIKKPSCLILAVSQATDPLAASVALNMARKVDPHGERTIGVLTKIDIMDDGTDARKVLENKVVILQRGFVGVKNRSQSEIDKKKSISAALEDERKFFEENVNYKHIAHRMGTPHLERMLNQELTEHIRVKLPCLESELKQRFESIEKEIEEFKGLHSDTTKDMQLRMIG